MGFTAPFSIETPPPIVWGREHAGERELPGAVLADASLSSRMKDLVPSEDFSTGIHASIFELFERAARETGWAVGETIPDRLGAHAWDVEGGVPAYLGRLVVRGAAPNHVERLAREIHAVAAARRTVPEPIDVDPVAWSQRQAELFVRLAERPDAVSCPVDRQGIVADVHDVRRLQTSGVVRKMELIIERLLKALSDPDAPSRNRWRIEVGAWVVGISRDATPSMRRLIDLDAVWQKGRLDAAAELADYGARLPRTLPDACPFTFDELTQLKPTFDALLEKLAASSDITPTNKP